MNNDYKKTGAVLILEDEEGLVDVIHDLVEMNFGESLVVIGARTVEQAKHLFSHFFPHIRVVMVDQNLGKGCSLGEDFVHWIKGETRYEGTLVAFSSCEHSLDCLLKAGCKKAIQKPVLPGRFIDFVGQYAET